MKNYFYIITRDNQIFEIKNTGNRLSDSLEAWRQGGLIVFSGMGININAVDVSKILNEEQYNNFVDTARPKMFIKNGSWYEIGDRFKPIRHEKWKQDILDNQKKLPEPEIEQTPEQKQRIKQIRADISAMFPTTRK